MDQRRVGDGQAAAVNIRCGCVERFRFREVGELTLDGGHVADVHHAVAVGVAHQEAGIAAVCYGEFLCIVDIAGVFAFLLAAVVSHLDRLRCAAVEREGDGVRQLGAAVGKGERRDQQVGAVDALLKGRALLIVLDPRKAAVGILLLPAQALEPDVVLGNAPFRIAAVNRCAVGWVQRNRCGHGVVGDDLGWVDLVFARIDHHRLPPFAVNSAAHDCRLRHVYVYLDVQKVLRELCLVLVRLDPNGVGTAVNALVVGGGGVVRPAAVAVFYLPLRGRVHDVLHIVMLTRPFVCMIGSTDRWFLYIHIIHQKQ